MGLQRDSLIAAGLCNFDRGPRNEGGRAGGSCPPQSPKAATSRTRPMVFLQLSQKLSKGANMALFIPGILGVSYATFAFFRYTGPDLGGDVPGSPKTTSPEWQAASVEYAKAQKANPIRHFKD